MKGKKLRDPVHGDLQLTGPEVELLDTPQMQRLRGIRQLGAAYYVYPGAQHSRFEHSLGTCWMTRRIISALEDSNGLELSPVERQAACLASLAHDVTHIPFGHTFEDERRLTEKHDRSRSRYEYFFEQGEMAEVLESSEAGRLARSLLDPAGEKGGRRQYLRDIVSGTICADLLDYLKRDNYYCGLKYEFDERVFHYFRVAADRLALDLMQDGMFRRDALTEITNLLRIRYMLSERVYYHHAKIAAGVMISKAVEGALSAGLTDQELCCLTDHSLLYYLGEHFERAPGVAELVQDFVSRRLFKRCYMLTRGIGEDDVSRLVAQYHFDRDDARTEAEAAIAEELGTEPHRVAIYCAPEGMALKEAHVPVLLGRDQPDSLAELNSDEIETLKKQHRALWNFYVFLSRNAGDRLERAGKVCEGIVGLPNELPRQMRGELL